MPEHKLSYRNIAHVLEHLHNEHGDGFEFRVSQYEPVYVKLFPEDEERLRLQEGHTLHQTIGGRLWHYWKRKNGEIGPSIERLLGEPDPLYRITRE